MHFQQFDVLSFDVLFFVLTSGLFDFDGLHNPERHRPKLPLPPGEMTVKSRNPVTVAV